MPRANELNPEVSEKSVGWHIDHSLRVISGICQQLVKSDPAAYRPKFSFGREYILLTGQMPRGRGRAPKAVVAPGEVTAEDLRQQMELCQQALGQIDGLPPNSHFFHPYFGMLNLKTTHRFLKIHTRHHLKIIRDILKKG